MFDQKSSLLDAENDVEGSLELFVTRIDVFFSDQLDQLRHDRLVAVRERGQARAQRILSLDPDVAVVRRRLNIPNISLLVCER